MIFEDNKKLVIELKKLMLEEDISQRNIADELKIKPQSLTTLLGKKNFSFEDCKKILGIMGYDLEFNFIKKE